MLKIGITGGIGTGKSTVCKVFNVLGIPTFDADREAKSLYDTNAWLKEQVIDRFGGHIYVDGQFQKQEMAKIVFNNQQALRDLNAMVHPLVIQQGEEWFANQQTPYAIKEAALLIESGGDKKMDGLILVQAPIEERISRIKSRDQKSEEEIKKRMDKQMSEGEKVQYADYIIQNGPKDFLIDQVLKIHSKVISLCD